MLALSITLLLLFFFAIGMPIAFGIGAAGAIGLYVLGGIDMVLSFLETTSLSGAANYELMTIPMFVLMAEFVIVSGVADDLFDTVHAWVKGVRGGLGISTILTGAAFGAICGSSAASAATLSSFAIPQMVKHGYERRLASGLTSVVGTLAVMIPPSNGLVIYGILSEVNIGKLLVAGFFPGILGALALIVTLQIQIWRRPSRIGGRDDVDYTLEQKIRMLRSVLPMVLLFVMVTGLLYLGIATPTEASALGAFGALVLAVARRRLTRQTFLRAIYGTARTTTMIVMIIIGALIFGYFLTVTQTTQAITSSVAHLAVAPWMILTVILLIKLVLGAFMDQIALLVLTVPITLPIIVALGYDPLWYGIILTLTSEIGLVTPPIGLNVYVVARYNRTPPEEVFAGVAPYVLSMLVLLVLLVAFPDLVLWVPRSMGN